MPLSYELTVSMLFFVAMIPILKVERKFLTEILLERRNTWITKMWDSSKPLMMGIASIGIAYRCALLPPTHHDTKWNILYSLMKMKLTKIEMLEIINVNNNCTRPKVRKKSEARIFSFSRWNFFDHIVVGFVVFLLHCTPQFILSWPWWKFYTIAT